MGLFFRNFGVEFHDQDQYNGMIQNAVSNGRSLCTYNIGERYINYEYGRIQLSFRVVDRNGCDVVASTDMQGSSNSIWTVRVSNPCMSDRDYNRSVRKIWIKHIDDGRGMAVVNVINPDILPSYAVDEILTLQISALPISIEYFSTQEEYRDTITSRWAAVQSSDEYLDLPAPGVMEATGYLDRQDEQHSHNQEHPMDDDIMLFSATVKTIKKLFLTDEIWYYVVTVDTEFGELEIIHSEVQVPREERHNIVPGATIHCGCHLVADPAIDEYEHGAIFDEENDLKLLRHVLSYGEVYRLRGALANNAVYTTHDGQDSYAGADNIVKWLTYANEHGKHCDAYVATVTASLDDRYRPGDRCVAQIYEGEDFIYSLAFIRLDADGKIIEINNVRARHISCELDHLTLTDRGAKLGQSATQITANTLFRQYYQSMLEIAHSSMISHNAEFELMPAMIAVADWAAFNSKKDRQEISKALWIEAQLINRNIDGRLLAERSNFYGKRFIENLGARCEWCAGNDSIANNSVVGLYVAILGDILYNPECAYDYDHAPLMLQDTFQTATFAQNVIRPIYKKFNEFYGQLLRL